MHPLIRLRLKIAAAERGAVYARKLGREDLAERFERTAIRYRTSLHMGRRASARAARDGTPENAIPVAERD